MGIWEQMSDRFMEALGKEFQFSPPQKHGLDAVCGMQAMHEGKIGVFVGLGGNLLSAGPDTEYSAEAFRRLKLSVFISTKLNRNHLITGEQSLILPCLGRSEEDVQASGPQIVSCENSMGVVQESRGRLRPASPNLMSETAIVCRIAKTTLGGNSTVDWMGLCGNYDRIRDHIEHVIPGFANYNQRVRASGGFYLPNLPRDKQEFPTKTGKANFVVHPIPKWTLKPNELLMMSLRSHDQFNTTIYGQNDRYRGITGGRRVIFMNPLDIDRLNFRSGQWVDLTSEYEGIRRHAKQFMIVPYEIPTGCVGTYYPEIKSARTAAACGGRQQSTCLQVDCDHAGSFSRGSRYQWTFVWDVLRSRSIAARGTLMTVIQTTAGPSSVCVQIDRLCDGGRSHTEDLLTIEEPLEIRLSWQFEGKRQQRSLSITMRTPGSDQELAAGFLFGEGIVQRSAEIVRIAHCGPRIGEQGLRNVVRVELAEQVELDWSRFERHFHVTSSCGICGKTSLEAVSRQGTAPQPLKFQVDSDVLYSLPDRLRAEQAVFDTTGGLHAAALFDQSGKLLSVREDVGRHNALDKLVGAELLAERLPLAEPRILLLSGRASFELLQKATAAGIGLVAAIGAPSSLAVDLARQSQITLVGFLRNGRCNVYCVPERIR